MVATYLWIFLRDNFILILHKEFDFLKVFLFNFKLTFIHNDFGDENVILNFFLYYLKRPNKKFYYGKTPIFS